MYIQNYHLHDSRFVVLSCFSHMFWLSVWQWSNLADIDDGLNRPWYALRWHHNDRDGVSNHQPYDCLLYRLFRCRSKKTSKLRVTGFCAGNSPGAVNSPHKRPVTRKMFPFDDVIMDRNKTKHNKFIWVFRVIYNITGIARYKKAPLPRTHWNYDLFIKC